MGTDSCKEEAFGGVHLPSCGNQDAKIDSTKPSLLHHVEEVEITKQASDDKGKQTKEEGWLVPAPKRKASMGTSLGSGTYPAVTRLNHFSSLGDNGPGVR